MIATASGGNGGSAAAAAASDDAAHKETFIPITVDNSYEKPCECSRDCRICGFYVDDDRSNKCSRYTCKPSLSTEDMSCGATDCRIVVELGSYGADVSYTKQDKCTCINHRPNDNLVLIVIPYNDLGTLREKLLESKIDLAGFAPTDSIHRLIAWCSKLKGEVSFEAVEELRKMI